MKQYLLNVRLQWIELNSVIMGDKDIVIATCARLNSRTFGIVRIFCEKGKEPSEPCRHSHVIFTRQLSDFKTESSLKIDHLHTIHEQHLVTDTVYKE